MSIPFETVLSKLSKAQRKEIQRETARLVDEYPTIVNLYEALDLSRAKLAKDLSISQVSVAWMEKRSDLLISTVRSYVEAMGGELHLVVRFPGKKPVVLKGLGELSTEL